MKKDIHPDYVETTVTCTCGNTFTTRSTAKNGLIHADVCSNCHPFYTGKQKILDTGGRVARFEATAPGAPIDQVHAMPRVLFADNEFPDLRLERDLFARLREDARREVRDAVGGDASTAVIFVGSGSTAAIDRLVGILSRRVPADLDARYRLTDHIPAHERPVVLIGPYEHHSNELPWRESIAEVVTVPEDASGHVDLAALEAALVRYADRPLLIGSLDRKSVV